MSCRDTGRNCVCDAVEAIADAQNAVEDRCATSCFENLLSPTLTTKDTIPFVLIDKSGDLLKATGNIGTQRCFQTVFFRVNKVRDCCATLELLASDDFDDLRDPCDLDANDDLIRTDNCIEVDLTCFCAIQCFSPDLVR